MNNKQIIKNAQATLQDTLRRAEQQQQPIEEPKSKWWENLIWPGVPLALGGSLAALEKDPSYLGLGGGAVLGGEIGKRLGFGYDPLSIGLGMAGAGAGGVFGHRFLEDLLQNA